MEELLYRLNGKSKKKRYNKDYFKEIFSGEKKPKYSDLKKLDYVLKRGIPFFLLNEVLKENLFTGFRKRNKIKLSPKRMSICSIYEQYQFNVQIL